MGEFQTLDVGDKTSRLYTAGDFSSGSKGVVLYHAWWGLNEDVVGYADRLAAAGFAVVAPDMFDDEVASTIEEAEGLTKASDEEAIDAIGLATIDHLAERLGPEANLAAIGFSFGAHWSMWSPAQRDSFAASVLYYGTTGGDILAQASVPVLGHFAENDPYETNEWVAEFESTLRSAGREVVIYRYPDTGHWFAEPSKHAFRPEAADLAFSRTVDFLERQLRRG